jgi:excisionase family DNA binding protein
MKKKDRMYEEFWNHRKQLYTIPECADYLDVSPQHVRDMIRRGVIVGEKLKGGGYLMLKQSIDHFNRELRRPVGRPRKQKESD